MAGTWQAATFALLVADLSSSRNFRLLWTTLPVIGLILLGAGIIALAKRWYERPRPLKYSASDELAHFRSLYEEGELDEEEFNRLQAVLGDRIKKELDLPAAPPSAAAPQSSAAPPGTTQPAAAPAPPLNGVPSPDGPPTPDNLREPPGPQGLEGR